MPDRTIGVSRRRFIAAPAALAAAGPGGAAPPYTRIYLAPESEPPLRTAAAEIAARTGASLVDRAHRGRILAGEVVLAAGRPGAQYPEAAAMVDAAAAEREWDLVKRDGEGLLIAGSSARNVCHAALRWVENPAVENEGVSTYRFAERFTSWDNPLNQMYRFSREFDRRRHIRELARMGHTAVEINRYASAGGYFVRHRRFPDDSYTWYLSYAPALDAFVESSLTQGLYPRDELAANLADLKEAAAIARSYGLKPGFVCYEPRCVPEAIFDRYPQLRGSRTDHPGRSLEPRYALDIANPRVLEHYAELMANLMAEVPDLRYLMFWTADSGSGIPFTRGLYAGPNGSYLARAKTVEGMTADFTRALLEAGRKVNPEFEVIMEITWEYSDAERKKITAALPKGVTLSHDVGGFVFSATGLSGHTRFIKESREMGVTPYAAMAVSSRWEQAPLLGLPSPGMLARKMGALGSLGAKGLFTAGGTFAPPQCPYHINQELYAEMIRRDVPDLEAFLLRTATRWCEGDARAGAALARAWQSGDEALAGWRTLTWYDGGPGQTQGRWITRPVVPDITRLSASERAAFERSLFTLPWDIGRVNIAFEGGIRMYEDSRLDEAVRNFDEALIPGLERTVRLLDEALAAHGKRVLEDQRDRYRGFLLGAKTVRNLFDSQVAINRYLLAGGNAPAELQRLRAAIQAEITNTDEWLRVLRQSRTYFFRVAEEETPFLYRTPVQDLQVKLQAMRAHIGDQPGPDRKELREPFSARRLLFYE